MSKNLRTELLTCLQMMLSPIARFCLRHSLTVQDFIEATRVVFVRVAAEEMAKSGSKVNISKLSISTGLQRQAVERIFKEGEIKDTPSRIDRIVGQWRYDRRFTTRSHKPRVLSIVGDDSEFNRLVRTVSKELHPSSILFELERLSMIERTDNGIKLKGLAYEPRQSAVEGAKLLARDVDDLISAVTDNIESFDSPELPNFHAASIFDNLSEDDLPKVRRWFYKACSNFHTRVERFLSAKDRDYSGEKKKDSGKRVVFTSFTRTR